jgi:hypothetical protein
VWNTCYVWSPETSQALAIPTCNTYHRSMRCVRLPKDMRSTRFDLSHARKVSSSMLKTSRKKVLGYFTLLQTAFLPIQSWIERMRSPIGMLSACIRWLRCYFSCQGASSPCFPRCAMCASRLGGTTLGVYSIPRIPELNAFQLFPKD